MRLFSFRHSRLNKSQASYVIAATQNSQRSKERISLEISFGHFGRRGSLVDAVGTLLRKRGETLDLCRQLIDRGVLVSEEEILGRGTIEGSAMQAA